MDDVPLFSHKMWKLVNVIPRPNAAAAQNSSVDLGHFILQLFTVTYSTSRNPVWNA
jgi:hypothetical protein